MAAALAGDAAAYHQLLENVQSWLQAYFRNRVPTTHIDDLVQETLISVHTKRATYDPARPFGPWLAAVARYRWIDHLRANKDQDHVDVVEELLPAPGGEATAGRDVETLLNFLPEEQATVIRLLKIQGHTVADTATRTGHSQSSVKVMMHRGLAKLQKLVREDVGV